MATTKRKLPIIDHEITKKCKGNSSSRLVYHLGQLPDEIILMILTYLNQSSIVAFGQTSRRNHAIASHSILWRRIDMSYKQINPEQLIHLLQRGIITLKMYQTTIRECDTWISMGISTLKHLDLTSAIISSEWLNKFLHSCNSLRKLSLASLSVNDQIIQKLVMNDQLDTLNLAMCTGLTNVSCQLLMNKLTVLRVLNIAWTNLSKESVSWICENIPRCIEQLNISGQRHQLTDDHIHSLTRRALRLRVLDISDSVLITDQSLISLRQYSRLLTHLSASRCYLLTSPALITLKFLPAFTHLDIFGTVSPILLQDIRKEFHGRIHLNLLPFSSIARPTIGIQRTSIWGLRTRL